MTVLVVDYGMGNIASARRALQECGADVVVSDDAASVRTASRVVIPGVGAFTEAMQRLQEKGWVAEIRQAAQEGVPVMGICLGMQLLADAGEEGGSTPGIGLIPGRIERMVPTDSTERIPHVGWNEVYPKTSEGLFAGIPSGSDFFFVHSYHFVPRDSANVLATTPYCGEVVSAVQAGRVVGVQFHPEKSSRAGFQMLRNFLAG